MNLTLSAQQLSFFTHHGYLELEALFSPIECARYVVAIQHALAQRGHASDLADEINKGRDLWRDTPELKKLLLSKTCSTLASSLAGKQQLRIGCDQWFPRTFSLPKPARAKELFSIQGISTIFLIRFEPDPIQLPAKLAPIGLLPFPMSQGSALIVQPNLLLNWPSLTASAGLYAMIYAETNAVYIHNPDDLANLTLRSLKYGYGDPLNNETHPRLRSS